MTPRGHWPRVWLLSALWPALVLMPAAVIWREAMWTLDTDATPRPNAPLTPGWIGESALLCLQVALAVLAMQLVLVAIMAVLERREPKSMPAWMLAGVIAGLPLVLYLLWPDVPLNPTIALMSFAPGIAGAAIARRIRHPDERF